MAITEKNSYKDYMFLTFTLSPSIYGDDPCEQYPRTHPLIEATLSKFKHTTVAEITNAYNLHYHSIIYVPDEKTKFLLMKRSYSMINRYKTLIGKRFNFFVFDSQASLDEKCIYIQKGQKDSQEYNYPWVLNDDHNIFNHFIDPVITERTEEIKIIVRPKKHHKILEINTDDLDIGII